MKSKITWGNELRIFDIMPCGIVVTEKLGGRAIYANDYARTLFGINKKEVEINKCISNIRFLKPDKSLCPRPELPASRAMFLGERLEPEELIIEHQSGDRSFVLVSATPLHNDKGEICGTIEVYDDFAKHERHEERRQKQEHLKHLIITQTEKLEKRTKRLKNEIIRHEKTREELRSLYSKLNTIHEEERLAIGRDLHDDIGQLLTALSITLDRMNRSVTRDRKQITEQAQQLVNQVNSKIQNLLGNIQRSIIDRMDFLPALQVSVDRFEALTQISVDFRYTGSDIDFPRDIKDTIYHIMQEALTNVARHANVKRAKAHLRVTKKKIRLTVEDSGKGFDPSMLNTAISLGLNSMRERARAIDGEMKIYSSPGKGTRIVVSVPLAVKGR
jgi:signal transduction histidine kinase